MRIIDEVNEILLKDNFELIIGTPVQNIKDSRFGERRITLIDKNGVLPPKEFNAKSETFDADNWFKHLTYGMKANNWRGLDTYFTKREELLAELFIKVKRIRKINELLRED